jgi:MFS family permease
MMERACEVKPLHTTDTQKSALNPTVVKLGIVSFFADVASEMLYPVTPIFLTTVLGASMSHLGLVEGIAEAIASFLKTYSGLWSDRTLRRRPFIVLGYLLGALSKPLIGISHSWHGVLGARALDRTGKGLRSSPRDALIAESVSAENRGKAFGWHRGMDTLGAAVGPVLAVILMSMNSGDLRHLYYWAVIPGLLSVVVALTVREQKAKTTRQGWKNPLSARDELSGPFKSYLYAWGLFSLTNSSDTFLLMRAKSVGFSTQTVILLYCAYNMTYSFSSPWLGTLSDKTGRKSLMVAGLCIYSLVYVGFGFASQGWQYWALFLIYGLYMGATDGVGKALAVDLSPSHLKATNLGILGTVSGLCTILASSFAGVIWDYWGPSWTFYYGAIGALIASLLIFRTRVHSL